MWGIRGYTIHGQCFPDESLIKIRFDKEGFRCCQERMVLSDHVVNKDQLFGTTSHHFTSYPDMTEKLFTGLFINCKTNKLDLRQKMKAVDY